jgi:hypothetical protein
MRYMKRANRVGVTDGDAVALVQRKEGRGKREEKLR